MTPLRRRDLVVVAVGTALAAWLLVRAYYGALPPLDWWLPVPLGVLAVAEALGARTLRARLAAMRRRRSPSRDGARAATVEPLRPVDPLVVARVAVLAQASAYLGSALGGIWLGTLLHVLSRLGRLQAAGGDTGAGVLGVVCGAGLVAAALFLESVCRVPPDRDEDRGPDRAR